MVKTRGGSSAPQYAWGWQRVEDARREAGAGGPDLDGDELTGYAVEVVEAMGDALADDIVGFAGWEPNDVSVSVVVGERRQCSWSTLILKFDPVALAAR